MGSGQQLAVTAAAVLCAVLLLWLAALVVGGRRRRRSLADELDGARAQIGALEQRLDALAREVRRPAPPQRAADGDDDEGPDYVITTAGAARPEPADAPGTDLAPLTAGQFASVALGESLVRVVSLGYGVRRALSAENRNRIGFEMRREVRRSRKERKRRLRLVRRGLRNGDAPPAGQDAA